MDLIPALGRRFRSRRERRELERALWRLEWAARLRFRTLRGFAWLSREQRCALLESWEHSCLASRRRHAARLRDGLEGAWGEWRQSREGA